MMLPTKSEVSGVCRLWLWIRALSTILYGTMTRPVMGEGGWNSSKEKQEFCNHWWASFSYFHGIVGSLPHVCHPNQAVGIITGSVLNSESSSRNPCIAITHKHGHTEQCVVLWASFPDSVQVLSKQLSKISLLNATCHNEDQCFILH